MMAARFVRCFLKISRKETTLAKRFQVEILETKTIAIVQMLEKEAPRTCEAMWEILNVGYTVPLTHARWAGPEVVAFIPPEARGNVDPEKIGIEHATMYPARGDVTWMYFRPGMYQMMMEGAWDLAFIYDTDCRFYIPAGMVTMNVWGRIVEGLDEFCEEVKPYYPGQAPEPRIRTVKLSALQ